jgi:hypothetical protein
VQGELARVVFTSTAIANTSSCCLIIATYFSNGEKAAMERGNEMERSDSCHVDSFVG